MDWAIVAVMIGLAYFVGEIFGYYLGRRDGLQEGRIRRRLEALPKPWEQR